MLAQVHTVNGIVLCRNVPTTFRHLRQSLDPRAWFSLCFLFQRAGSNTRRGVPATPRSRYLILGGSLSRSPTQCRGRSLPVEDGTQQQRTTYQHFFGFRLDNGRPYQKFLSRPPAPADPEVLPSLIQDTNLTVIVACGGKILPALLQAVWGLCVTINMGMSPFIAF
ncbi:hypothetical protein BDW02DRAFT_385779 [Decorospora gaudefroyi]|uniref:Uncharacterized protein n=1 Tax=Decorospora gaudefroyi TaxID=184978 RepID=A0A6A5K9S4_9PLEO|nr:hypothetical protein BDW02DRAFT_385779 [Decorospora gaudefroyi]